MLGQTTLFPPDLGLPLRRRISVELASLADVSSVLKQFHYLHRCRVGRQLNYVVYLDGVVDGVITYAYPMTSAAIDGVPSDELVEFARLYLHHNIPHSASCAIGKTLRRVRDDWMALFPESKKPRLVVSWSDKTRHVGTVYKASNFRWLRCRVGKIPCNNQESKRGTRVAYGDYKNEKDCWLYDL